MGLKIRLKSKDRIIAILVDPDLLSANLFTPQEPVMSFRCFNISRPKDLITTDIRATYLLSLNHIMLHFLGTGMMVEHLKQEKTSNSFRNLCKVLGQDEGQLVSAVSHHFGDTPSCFGALRFWFSEGEKAN